MIFRVKHVDVQHHRRAAIVTAKNNSDCIDQIERELGDHIGLSVCRMSVRPKLCLLPTPAHFEKRKKKRNA
ncbi:MAG: hypothetical protein V4451_04780 [Pseudomonadota bacterium]